MALVNIGVTLAAANMAGLDCSRTSQAMAGHHIGLSVIMPMVPTVPTGRPRIRYLSIAADGSSDILIWTGAPTLTSDLLLILLLLLVLLLLLLLFLLLLLLLLQLHKFVFTGLVVKLPSR